jgi:hypothetical protein
LFFCPDLVNEFMVSGEGKLVLLDVEHMFDDIRGV